MPREASLPAVSGEIVDGLYTIRSETTPGGRKLVSFARKRRKIYSNTRVIEFYLPIYSILMKKVRTGYELFHKTLY